MKSNPAGGHSKAPRRAEVRRGIEKSSMSGGDSGGFWLPAQGLEPFQICLDLMLTVEAVIIISPQVAVWEVVLEHMPNYREDGMGYGNGGAVFTPPGGNALVLCVKIRVFYLPGRFRALGQHGLEGFIALVRSAVLPLPRTLMVARRHPCPGTQVGGTGEPLHIQPNLCQDHLGAAPGNAGDLVDGVQSLGILCHILSTIPSSTATRRSKSSM